MNSDDRTSAQRAAERLPSPEQRRPVAVLASAAAFFIVCGLVLAGALLSVSGLRTAVTALLVSTVLWVVIFPRVSRSGALSMAMTTVDSQGAVRVVVGVGAVQRSSAVYTKGPDRFLRREYLIGFASVVVGVAAIVIAILIDSSGGAVLGLILLLAWTMVMIGWSFGKAAWHLRHSGDRVVEATRVVPLAAAYLAKGGSAAELRAGVPADMLVNGLGPRGRELSDAYGRDLEEIKKGHVPGLRRRSSRQQIE